MDIYSHYEKTESYYKFYNDDGKAMIVPTSDVILIDDESGFLAVKLIASRKTIGLVPKE
jgi:hypothetical protein